MTWWKWIAALFAVIGVIDTAIAARAVALDFPDQLDYARSQAASGRSPFHRV